MKKIKLQTGDWVLLGIFFLIINIICAWLIDISVAAMIAIAQGADAILTNGFALSDPVKMYHIGLYGIILSTFCLIMIIVHVYIDRQKSVTKDV